MSQENVELVRGLQPNPDTDLVTLFRDEAAFAALTEAVSPFLHEDFEVVAEISLAGGTVWTVRDGKVARVAFFPVRSDALEAAGLSG